MHEQMRRCAVGLLALGLTSSFGLAASAQQFDDDDGYVVEERYLSDEPDPPVAMFDDDDDDDGDEVRVVYRSGMQRCADTFRSFNPNTGTYVTYQGEIRICPYLE